VKTSGAEAGQRSGATTIVSGSKQGPGEKGAFLSSKLATAFMLEVYRRWLVFRTKADLSIGQAPAYVDMVSMKATA
jgi:hypothetical protein